MNVRRALIIGLGAASLTALRQLGEQLTDHGLEPLPVVCRVLIARSGDQHSLPPGVLLIEIPPGGQVQTSPELRDAIAPLIAELLQGEHIWALQQRGVHVQAQLPIELIIVGNLADELVAQSILDLARLVYPLIDEHQAPAQSLAAALFLVIPWLSQMGQAKETQQQMMYDQLIALNAYLRIGQDGGLFLEASERAVRHVYLIEQANMAAQAVPNHDSLFCMIGGWLLSYLTDGLPLNDANVANGNAPAAFRSLGYASISVPLRPLAAILSDWFITRAFSDYLLATPGTAHKPGQDPKPQQDEINAELQDQARNKWIEAGLTHDRLKSDLLTHIDPALSALRPDTYRNTPFHHYREIEQRLIGDYSRILDKEMPRRSERYAQNHRAILKRAEVSLDKIRTHYFDTYELGVRAPVRTAIVIFDRIATEMKRRGEEQREEIVRLEKEINAGERTIIAERERFWDTAQNLGRPPFIFPTIAMLTILVVVSYLAWIMWTHLGQPTLTVAYLISILATMAAGFIITLRRVERQKFQMIESYADRLKLLVQQHEARAMRILYADLMHMTQTFHTDIERFKQHLQGQLARPVDEKRAPSAVTELSELERQIDPQLLEQMCKVPCATLGVSLLRKEDLGTWYHEIFTAIDWDLRDFFARQKLLSGWYHDWALSGHTPQPTLRVALERWVHEENPDKLPRLWHEPISRYLGAYARQEQQGIIEQLYKTAHIYSRLNIINQDRLPQVIIRIGEQDQLYVKELFQEIGGDPLFWGETTQPLHVSALSVLNNLPLDAFQIGWDLAPPGPHDARINTRLSISSIVALAIATGVLQYNTNRDELGYNRIIQIHDPTQTTAFINLGTSYTSVVTRLGMPSQREHFKTISDMLVAKLDSLTANDPHHNALCQILNTYLGRSVDSAERPPLTIYLRALLARANGGS